MNNVNNIINEVIQRLFENRIYGIRDLAELGSRLGVSEDIMLEIFQDAFRQGGDEEVVKLATSMTGQPVYVLSRGKYSFQSLYSPESLNEKKKKPLTMGLPIGKIFSVGIGE